MKKTNYSEQVLKRHRYPGVKPFSEQESDIFFGRESELDKLQDLLFLENLVILFARSGYGKSSLINAGLIPLIIQSKDFSKLNYWPLIIKFNSFEKPTTETIISPITQIIEKITSSIAEEYDNPFSEIEIEDSLWFFFKKVQGTTGKRFVLILDQFEEFFTFPLEEQKRFKEQLAELLYTDFPPKLRDQIGGLPAKTLELIEEPIACKVLISIRSDRLSLLDSMKDALPLILQTRYELFPLTNQQAKNAILNPAALRNDTRSPLGKFSTPPFAYSDEAVNIILSNLTDSFTKGIEAFLLQVVCHSIENRLEEKFQQKRFVAITTPIVGEADLPSFTTTMERYYEQQFEKIPEHVQADANTVITQHLIFNDGRTELPIRLSVDRNALPVDQSVLDCLENSFIIRREPNLIGGFNYELSHDKLLGPILKKNNEWRVALEKSIVLTNTEVGIVQTAKNLEKKEKDLLEESDKLKTKKKYVLVAAFALLVMFLILITFSYFIYIKYEELTNREANVNKKIEKSNDYGKLYKEKYQYELLVRRLNDSLSKEIKLNSGSDIRKLNKPATNDRSEKIWH